MITLTCYAIAALAIANAYALHRRDRAYLVLTAPKKRHF